VTADEIPQRIGRKREQSDSQQFKAMSAFDDWYNSTIAPTLPHDLPEHIRQAARMPLIACWNAALEAACDEFGKHEGTDYDIHRILKAE